MVTTQVDGLLEKHGSDASAAVAILQDVQRQDGYLPRRTLTVLSQRMQVPLSRLYALATFYRAFSLVPTGRHRISVCLGTACHVRGGQRILDRLEMLLGIRAGSTTPDREVTLTTVRCLGCCSLGPMVRVDDEIHGKVTQGKVEKIVEKLRDSR